VAGSEADGVVFYHWKDLLEDEVVSRGRMTSAVRAFRDGALRDANWALTDLITGGSLPTGASALCG